MLGDNMALPYKLVLVVRTDLNMQKGKMMAQCAHAAVGTVLELQESKSTFLRPWLNQGQPKIVVKANSVVEIFALEKQAKTVGVPTYAIHDAGRTQVAAGSLTVLAVGPAPAFLVDQVTKDLKLM